MRFALIAKTGRGSPDQVIHVRPVVVAKPSVRCEACGATGIGFPLDPEDVADGWMLTHLPRCDTGKPNRSTS